MHGVVQVLLECEHSVAPCVYINSDVKFLMLRRSSSILRVQAKSSRA